MIINFYCLRHGEKRGKDHPEGEDGLTEKGKQQVVTAAKKHLSGIIFDKVLYSGLKRALETANLVIETVNSMELMEKILLEPDLDYRWHLDEDVVPVFQYSDAEKRLKDRGAIDTTVYDWLKEWPPAFGHRQRMTGLLKRLAILQGIFSPGATEINILMTGHSPVLETAAPHTKEFPRLKEADICLYIVGVNGIDVEIKSAIYLPCPPLE